MDSILTSIKKTVGYSCRLYSLIQLDSDSLVLRTVNNGFVYNSDGTLS